MKQVDERVTYSLDLIQNLTNLVKSSINKVTDETRNLAHELAKEMVIRQHVEHVIVNIHTINSTIKVIELNLMQFRQTINLTATGRLSSYLIPPHLMTEHFTEDFTAFTTV
jgi:glutathione synthase/RimK-type ligase-like ATP-grasp enzyme